LQQVVRYSIVVTMSRCTSIRPLGCNVQRPQSFCVFSCRGIEWKCILIASLLLNKNDYRSVSLLRPPKDKIT